MTFLMFAMSSLFRDYYWKAPACVYTCVRLPCERQNGNRGEKKKDKTAVLSVKRLCSESCYFEGPERHVRITLENLFTLLRAGLTFRVNTLNSDSLNKPVATFLQNDIMWVLACFVTLFKVECPVSGSKIIFKFSMTHVSRNSYQSFFRKNERSELLL